MEDNGFRYEEEELIDLGKYWDRLKKHWKTILRYGAAAFVLGCVLAVCTPRKYTVVSKLAPELSSTATNRLSSVASLVGLSANVLGTTDAVYPMVYPEIVKSPDFLADLFNLEISFTDRKEAVDTTLYAYLLNYQRISPVAAVMSLPGRIAGLFARKDGLDTDTGINPHHFTKQQGRVARMLGKAISADIDKKTLILTMTVTMQNAEVCAAVAEAVNDNLRSYVTAYRTEKAVKDCEYYEKLFNEAREAYYAAQREYSNYSDSHQNVTLKSYMIESERLKNEASLQYQLYTSTAQQLQNAQAKVQLETPVFAEIIPPSVPLKSANSRKKTALAFALLGLMAGCAAVLFKSREE